MVMAGVSAQAHPPLVTRAPNQGVRMALLALLLVSLLATGVSVAGFFVPGAVVAACFVMAFYVALVVHRAGELLARARDEVAPDEGEVLELAPDPPADSIVAERAEWRLGLAIALPLVVLAILLGGFLVGWRIAALGALAFFGMMVLMGAPVWLAAVEDEIEDAAERADLPHPPSIK